MRVVKNNRKQDKNIKQGWNLYGVEGIVNADSGKPYWKAGIYNVMGIYGIVKSREIPVKSMSGAAARTKFLKVKDCIKR